MVESTPQLLEQIQHQALLIGLDESSSFFQVNVQMNQQPNQQKSQKRQIFIAVDKSGSMSGSYINTTKDMTKKLIKMLIQEQNQEDIFILEFQSVTKVIDLKAEFQNDINKIENRINEIQASGGTCFTKVVNQMTGLIRTSEKVKALGYIPVLTIIFMTDGVVESEDKTNNYKDFNKAFQNLEKATLELTHKCEFHTIGLGKSHDPLLLERLTNMGKTFGSYQYISEISEFQSVFENIQEMMKLSIINGEVYSSEPQTKFVPLKFKFNELQQQQDNTTTTLTQQVPSQLFLQGEIIIEQNIQQIPAQTLNLRIIFGENQSDICIQLKVDLPNKGNQQLNIRIQFGLVKKILKNVTEEIKNIQQQENINKQQKMEILEKLLEKFNESRLKFQFYVKEIFKLHPSERTEMFAISEPLQDYMNSIQQLISSAFTNQISNDMIATVNSLAYKDIIQNNIKKQMVKRAQVTVKILNEVYEKVEAYSKTLNQKKLEESYSKLCDELGQCFLSCANFIEAMIQKDCLCITFNCSRSEVAIVEPTDLQINQIFPTFISAQSFLESVKYALNIQIDASGGFNKEKQGKIIKGAAQENINGALPIFICNENWEIAKLLMKPVLGWTTTLDPVGYSYEQKKAIPFMILAKIALEMLENPEKEFPQKMFKYLLDTCMHILLDDDDPTFGGTMKAEIREKFINYPINGEIRTSDQIKSNIVMLMHFYCTLHLGWVNVKNDIDPGILSQYPNYWEYLFELIIEEELRRYQTPWEENLRHKNLQVLLNIDQEKHIKAFADLMQQKISAEDYKQDENEEQKRNEINSQKDLQNANFFIKLEEIVGHKNNLQQDAVHEYQKLLANNYQIKSIIKLKKLFETSFGFQNNYQLMQNQQQIQKEKIENNVQNEQQQQIQQIEEHKEPVVKLWHSELGFLSMYVQNKVHYKNVDRKNACKYKFYCDTRKDQEAEFLLLKVAQDVIEVESNKLNKWKIIKNKQQKIANYQQINIELSTRSEMIRELLRTENLDDAVRIFKHLNKKSRIQYFYIFKNYYSRGGAELMEKLKMLMTGKYKDQVIFDEWTQNDFFPKGKILKQIFRDYKGEIDLNEWKQLFQ